CLVGEPAWSRGVAMWESMLLWICLAVLSGVALNHLFPSLPAPVRAARMLRIASLAALVLGFLSVAWFATGAAVAKPTLPADEVATGRWARANIAPGRPVQGSPLRD